jgi:hypothetical protein
MKCEFNKEYIDGIPVLEGINNKDEYDIICSAKELIKECFKCGEKCDERYNNVRFLDSKK